MLYTLSQVHIDKINSGLYFSGIKNNSVSNNKNKCELNYSKFTNFYYKPTFTSKEFTDDEFDLKLKDFVNRLRARNIPQDIADELVYEGNITKENIDLAEILLFDRTIDKQFLNMPKTLLYTDKDNVNFAIRLCKNSKYPRTEIPNTLVFINAITEPLAKKLLERGILHKNGLYVSLTQFTEDPLAGIGEICANCLKTFEDFPEEIIEVFMPYLSQEEYDLIKKIYKDNKLTRKEAAYILENLCNSGLPVLKMLLQENKDIFSIENSLQTIKNYDTYLKKENINELIEKVNHQKKLVFRDPDKYTSSFTLYTNNIWSDITEMFGSKYGELILLASFLDKESLDVLFRKRLPEVNNKIKEIKQFSFDKLFLLKRCLNCKLQDGKPLSPKDKFDLIDIIYSYNINNLNSEIIYNLIKNNVIDIELLKKQMLLETLTKAVPAYKDLIYRQSDEKLKMWDINYIPQLSIELSSCVNSTVSLQNVIEYTLKDDFKSYIQNPQNLYGEHNANTKKEFGMFNLNYEKWVNPPKSAEVRFVSIDRNAEKLSQIAALLVEDIETLRNINPAVKRYIDNKFPKFTNDGKFSIPQNYQNNKEKLGQLTSHLVSDLTKVWTRAEKNRNNPNEKLRTRAEVTLTILDHLNQRISDLTQISDEKTSKNLDYTIKMWDRVPQKDLFQGNYSTCCVGMGRANGKYMAEYLLNTSFNMIEIVDNSNGKVIGNALCYFVTGENLENIFVIDNIEINNSERLSEKNGKKLLKAITQYAQNISNEINGYHQTKIILGKSFNDLPVSNLEVNSEHIVFIGDISGKNIYLDLFGGAVNSETLYATRQFYRLN